MKLNRVGDVIVRCSEYEIGYFYRGVIVKDDETRSYAKVMLYNDHKVYRVRKDVIYNIGGTLSQPYIIHGDYVLCNVRDEFNLECFVPGVVHQVQSTPNYKFYLILYFNGQTGINKGCELVKITKAAYGLYVDEILSKMSLKDRVIFINTNNEVIKDDGQKEITEAYLLNIAELCLKVDELKDEINEGLKKSPDFSQLELRYKQLEAKIKSIETKSDDQQEKIKDLLELLQKIRAKIDSQKQFNKDFKKQQDDTQKMIQALKIKNPEKVQTSDEANQTVEQVFNLLGAKIKKELKRLKKELPKLAKNEQVLAKWSDDGWYYWSNVVEELEDHKYLIKDKLNNEEIISREDIISELTNDNIVEICDAVIAPHPNYSHSYAPGLIINTFDLFTVVVKFYDGVQSTIHLNDVYKIGLCKFEYDVDNIIKLELEWLNKEVIARNSLGQYELAIVKERLGNGKQFIVETSSGKTLIEDIIHMHGKENIKPNRRKLTIENVCVLSKSKANSKMYLTGKAIEKNNNTYKIKLINNEILENVNPNDFVWITEDYCDEISNLIKKNANNERKD